MTMKSKIYQDLPKDSVAYKWARKEANAARWASIKLLVSGWLIGAGVACLIILGMRLMF